MLRRIIAPLVVAAGLLIPATAGASVYRSSGEGVSATLVSGGSPTHPEFPTLTLTRGGTTLFHGQVTNRACGTGCGPSTAPADPPVRIAPLDGVGSADVLVNLYSGGANCCTVLDVLRASAALGGQYVVSAQHNFTFSGYRLEKLDGRDVFLTADGSFAAAFTDFADSGLPIQLLRLEGVRFVAVTAQHRRLVRRDAARWLTAYRRARGRNDVGFIGAWAADECTLGHGRRALSYVISQARAGRLHSTAFGAAESGMRFVEVLKDVLRHGGYRF